MQVNIDKGDLDEYQYFILSTTRYRIDIVKLRLSNRCR